MKLFVLLIVSGLCTTCCFAQDLPRFTTFARTYVKGDIDKPPVDTSVFGKWPSLGFPALSNDGNYVLYTINNQPINKSTLVIQAIHTKWKMVVTGVNNASFTQDSRMAVFLTPVDSLCLFTLETSFAEYIPQVRSFQLFRRDGDEWLAYHLNNPLQELIIRNMRTGIQRSFTNAVSYLLSSNGRTLLLKSEFKKDDHINQVLYWVDVASGNITTIWDADSSQKGATVDNFVFDTAGTQLAFVVVNNNQPERSFWYYKDRADKAVLLVDNQSPSIDSSLRLENISDFSKDGAKLFITLKEKEYPLPKPNAVKVDVWSYTDYKLQSQQLKELYPRSYAAVIHVDKPIIVRLELANEQMSLSGQTDDVVFITHREGEMSERNWNTTARASYYLVSTANGERKRLRMDIVIRGMSPTGKYLIGVDSAYSTYFSYNIVTGVTKNITQFLPIPSIDAEHDVPGPMPRGLRGIATWLHQDTALLIYDRYDIWQVDPAGKKPPINLTSGRRMNIVFRLAENYSDRTIAGNEKLILTAFDRNTKKSGFYTIMLGTREHPIQLTMDPYVYRINPVKARDKEVYVVMRESASEFPNYFYTMDFKTFVPLSHVYPESAYNWLTSELITWKTFDGRISQGALYKPENFDPKKKYPLIVHYYEKKSDQLNQYHNPEPFVNEINIPWFVSNGYIVFTPDIHYKIGFTGQSAYNSVVSAATYLHRFPWIDSTKMGIQGHSFGGYETNYIITHTNLFAAAMSAAGVSDFISAYGAVLGSSGASKQYFYEVHQSRIGATPWQRPDLYIKNSPIFYVHKVTTPLLMMHNKADATVPFAQGVEFFTALRRLGKKVWLLQYDDGRHSIFGEPTKDYTIRITQFFDHYLKGAPAPKWMTRGIPAKMKGIDNGLELDYEIKTPGEGLLAPEEKKKVKALEKKSPLTIQFD